MAYMPATFAHSQTKLTSLARNLTTLSAPELWLFQGFKTCLNSLKYVLMGQSFPESHSDTAQDSHSHSLSFKASRTLGAERAPGHQWALLPGTQPGLQHPVFDTGKWIFFGPH